ncbi:stromelysin-1-like [Pseudophryne corroboree]|uniref:stromelysin-1-like n=1 Tax=Pseudophryne corroboree TaxID=495146 RepID=UPI0030817164
MFPLWLFVQSLLLNVCVVYLVPVTKEDTEPATWEAPLDGNVSTDSEDITNEELTKAEEYLEQFYSEATRARTLAKKNEDKIKDMQTFFGLDVTGKVNKETLQVMLKPRCGVPDVKRFSLFPGNPKWEKTSLIYRIVNYTPDLTNSDVDYAIAQALRLWSEVTPLSFRQSYSGDADIMISFDYKDHGDFFPFDGPLGVLAHAFAPGQAIGGDAHFDEAETWTLGRQGTNLFLVALHELGHALGLEHSKNKLAIMYPTLQDNTFVSPPSFKLFSDDVAGIQALYGARKPSVPKPNPIPTRKPQPKPTPAKKPKPTDAPKSPTVPVKCDRSLHFDAITSMRGDLLFFKNGIFWRKTSRKSDIDTISINTIWPNLGYVDAAYEVPDRDIVYLFKGRQYWATRGFTMLSGYPRDISNFGFPSSVKKIDAAVFLKEERKAIFFVKDKYWSNDHTSYTMDPKSPQKIKHDFPGIGKKVEAAFQNYDYLYFSNGANQIEYNPRRQRVIRNIPNYQWLNCN